MAKEPQAYLDISNLAWAKAGQPDGENDLLIATVRVSGSPYHLEAYAVKIAENGVQVADTEDGELETKFEALYLAEQGDAGDGPWYTIEINGRDYVLVMTPYCE